MPAPTQLQTTDALGEHSDSAKQPNEQNRRALLKKAGMLLGAASALAAFNTPVLANDNGADANAIVGLWAANISSPDNSFPPFPAFETWGPGNPGIWLGSGQPDLTLAARSSTGWGIWRQIGPRKYRQIARFWTYDSSSNPTGFGTVDFTFTLSKDGNSYNGGGFLQFFDTNGNPVSPPLATTDNATRIA